MVDPVSAAAIVAANVFAGKLVEGAGSEAGKSVTGGVARLIDWIRHRGDEDPTTAAAITVVETMPTEESTIAVLAKALEARARADAAFERELLAQVGAAPEARTIQLSGGNYVERVGGHARVVQIAGDQINKGRPPTR